MSMGTWKKRKLVKGTRGQSTSSGKGRRYEAKPPAEGWPGGDPARNGYRAGGGRK